MLRFVIAVSLLLPISPAFGQTAAPPIAPASQRLVYLEVAPAEVNRVAAALKEYRRAAMNAVGALRIDVLQQVGRSNHFAIYETWRDSAALEGHQNAARPPQKHARSPGFSRPHASAPWTSGCSAPSGSRRQPSAEPVQSTSSRMRIRFRHSAMPQRRHSTRPRSAPDSSA